MINNLESVFTREFAAILDRMLRSLFAKIEYYWRDCFQEKLTSFHVSSSHLAEMWDWEHVGKDCSIPAASRIRNVHCLNVFRQHGGIWIKWKQYLTSAAWSDPILLIPRHRFEEVAAWRPGAVAFHFDDLATKESWLDKFELSLAQRSKSVECGAASVQWLRDAARTLHDVFDECFRRNWATANAVGQPNCCSMAFKSAFVLYNITDVHAAWSKRWSEPKEMLNVRSINWRSLIAIVYFAFPRFWLCQFYKLRL